MSGQSVASISSNFIRLKEYQVDRNTSETGIQVSAGLSHYSHDFVQMHFEQLRIRETEIGRITSTMLDAQTKSSWNRVVLT